MAFVVCLGTRARVLQEDITVLEAEVEFYKNNMKTFENAADFDSATIFLHVVGSFLNKAKADVCYYAPLLSPRGWCVVC